MYVRKTDDDSPLLCCVLKKASLSMSPSVRYSSKAFPSSHIGILKLTLTRYCVIKKIFSSHVVQTAE